jgi:hypothetical protein
MHYSTRRIDVRFGTYKHRSDDKIKINIKEIGCEIGLKSSGSRYGPVAGSDGHGNELSCSKKGEAFSLAGRLPRVQEGLCYTAELSGLGY